MECGPDGDPVLDWSRLTRAQTAALVEVTVDDFKDGRGEDARDVRRVLFKLADKRAALVDLGKYLGLFKDRLEIGADSSLGARLDAAIARAKGATPPPRPSAQPLSAPEPPKRSNKVMDV